MPFRARSGWADVIVERTIDGPLSRNDARLDQEVPPACSSLHKVEWLESLIGVDQERLICHFRAPDAESVRVALRNNGIEFDALWAGTVCAAGTSEACGLVAEHKFETPGPKDTREALSRIINECLLPRQLELNRAFISRDRTRAICVCRAPNNGNSAYQGAWPFMHLAARR